MSPILVRPVREQLEHDRIIRLLQAKLKRRHEVAANTGEEQGASVKFGTGQVFPDLVLTSTDRGRRLEGIVEVETGESVNHLEAMAQWAHFGRLKAPFHLYVPAAAVDMARRLCLENHVALAELWSYHTIGDQTRFTLVERHAGGRHAGGREEPRARAAAPAERNGRKGGRPSARKAAAPARRAAKPRAGRSKAVPRTSRTAKQKRK